MKQLPELRLIEIVAEFISDRFVLPDAAKITVRECGSPNAYWDPDYRELILCYDLISDLNKLGRAPAVEKLAAQFAATRK